MGQSVAITSESMMSLLQHPTVRFAATLVGYEPGMPVLDLLESLAAVLRRLDECSEGWLPAGKTVEDMWDLTPPQDGRKRPVWSREEAWAYIAKGCPPAALEGRVTVCTDLWQASAVITALRRGMSISQVQDYTGASRGTVVHIRQIACPIMGLTEQRVAA